jgi:hypothetical protein
MSHKSVALEHVLTSKETAKPDLEGMNADDLKRLARFWFGTTAANKFRKAEAARALSELLRDRARLEAGVRELPAKERQVLEVFMRYGGAMSGSLLLSELLARGMVEQPKQDSRSYYSWNRERNDPVSTLRGKLLLVSRHGGYSHYDYYSYSSYRLSYPDLLVLPAVRNQIEPAGPLPWKSSAPATAPATSSRRSGAEIALDLWTVAQALAQAGSWKTNRGGSLAKSAQNRLRKLFPSDGQDPLTPPEPEALYYEILRGLGAVRAEDGVGDINLAAAERHLRSPAAVQSWEQVRAWMRARLWQDGIGVVPDRDNSYDPVRIEPSALARARELLVWALCRVAHGADDWLDLETFLIDLGSARGEDTSRIYWHGYSWKPDFATARRKDSFPAGPERLRAFWLDSEGIWAANALMGTLGYLGLVERGTGKGKGRFCFRLTRLGKAVFGAPELTAELEQDPKFLTVQPNYELQAYLDAADASAVWPLAQMARRTSAAGGLVQTFALTRESVYQALESGLTLEEIRKFLRDHSKTGLPDNVDQSLSEWGRRREALVLRSGVSLGAYPPGSADPFPDAARARRVGENFVLMPRKTARAGGDWVVVDHKQAPRARWKLDEEGRVRPAKDSDAVALARLAQFADPGADGWQVTAASVRRARERGIPAEQVLDWLGEYLGDEVPPIMVTAIRNWSSPARIFLGDLLMLRVLQPQAVAMMLGSKRFRPLLAGHVPPDWFIVPADRRRELEQLLGELGFAASASLPAVDLPQAPEGPAEQESRSARPAGRGRRSRH